MRHARSGRIPRRNTWSTAAPCASTPSIQHKATSHPHTRRTPPSLLENALPPPRLPSIAANPRTCCSASKPSSSVSSWFTVLSRSSLPAPPPRRARPTASSSSMKMMHGASLRACGGSWPCAPRRSSSASERVCPSAAAPLASSAGCAALFVARKHAQRGAWRVPGGGDHARWAARHLAHAPSGTRPSRAPRPGPCTSR